MRREEGERAGEQRQGAGRQGRRAASAAAALLHLPLASWQHLKLRTCRKFMSPIIFTASS